MIPRIGILVLLAVLLGGCDPATLRGSVAGGECKIFDAPKYVVLGKRPYDQDWIDSTVEGGVGGCGWQRPVPRVAAIDAQPGQKIAAKPAKKIGLLRRIKNRVLPSKPAWPDAATPPVTPLPEPPAPVLEAPDPTPPAPPPPPKPRSAIDELLDPTPLSGVRR